RPRGSPPEPVPRHHRALDQGAERSFHQVEQRPGTRESSRLLHERRRTEQTHHEVGGVGGALAPHTFTLPEDLELAVPLAEVEQAHAGPVQAVVDDPGGLWLRAVAAYEPEPDRLLVLTEHRVVPRAHRVGVAGLPGILDLLGDLEASSERV